MLGPWLQCRRTDAALTKHCPTKVIQERPSAELTVADGIAKKASAARAAKLAAGAKAPGRDQVASGPAIAAPRANPVIFKLAPVVKIWPRSCSGASRRGARRMGAGGTAGRGRTVGDRDGCPAEPVAVDAWPKVESPTGAAGHRVASGAPGPHIRAKFSMGPDRQMCTVAAPRQAVSGRCVLA